MTLSKNKRIALGVAGAAILAFAFGFGKFVDVTTLEVFADSKMPVGDKNSANNPEANKIFSDDFIVGADPKNAVVKIIEYASFTCPHCAHFNENIAIKLKEKYKNSKEVTFIYRDFPLDGAALLASQLANCSVEKRGGFTDLLYAKQAEWTKAKTPEELKNFLFGYAKTGGLSKEKAEICFQSEDLKKTILEKQQHADKVFKITGTPTVIVNGENVKTELPDIEQAIAKSLQAEALRDKK